MRLEITTVVMIETIAMRKTTVKISRKHDETKAWRV